MRKAIEIRNEVSKLAVITLDAIDNIGSLFT